MSTKAIREALETLGALVECVNGKVAGRCAHCIGKAALSEVEAIERAAKTLSDKGQVLSWSGYDKDNEELEAAERVLHHIAEQD